MNKKETDKQNRFIDPEQTRAGGLQGWVKKVKVLSKTSEQTKQNS